MDQTKSVKTVRDESAVRQLQLITIAWMVVEFGISVYTGIRSHSVALTAFGADSAIELISAVVVFRRFRLGAGTERRTARISGALLYVLAAYILLTSGFSLVSKQIQPEPTVVGIGLLVAAGMIMPLLGRAKKKLAMETGSKALNADAAQSNICAYMSWIALAGLSFNYFFHLPWADSLAALALLPIVLKEAGEARKGETCEGC
jgi:divalent metal cation (Fe/Co/Zn/Cd) transporter